jgi:tripartite-type tricarboxylate transporter receptor subunit TctC
MRVLIVWALLWTTMAVAQPFPNRPLRIVVPFAVGGSPDVIARGLAAQLDPQLGKSVIVDNRAGANGIIGAEIVAKAAPDGHTLIHSPPAFVINALVYKNLPYDILRDFIPVTLAMSSPNILVVHPSLPVKSTRELIALAKARPGELNYAAGTIGATPHLAGEQFKVMFFAVIELINFPQAFLFTRSRSRQLILLADNRYFVNTTN